MKKKFVLWSLEYILNSHGLCLLLFSISMSDFLYGVSFVYFQPFYLGVIIVVEIYVLNAHFNIL